MNKLPGNVVMQLKDTYGDQWQPIKSLLLSQRYKLSYIEWLMLAASEQIWASYFFQSIDIQFMVNYRRINVPI